MINWLIGGAILAVFVWALCRTLRRGRSGCSSCGSCPQAEACRKAERPDGGER